MIALDKKLSEICTFDMQSLSVFLYEVGFILQAKRVEKFYNKFLIQVKCRSGALVINLENCSRVKLTSIQNFCCNFVIFLKKNEFFIDNGKLLSNKVCKCTFLSFVWTKISIGYTRGKTFFKNLHVKKKTFQNMLIKTFFLLNIVRLNDLNLLCSFFILCFFKQ